MIGVVVSGLVSYFRSLAVPDGILDGIYTDNIVEGHIDPLSHGVFPTMSIEMGGGDININQPGRIDLDNVGIIIWLYTNGETDLSVAHQALSKLLMSPDRKQGLLVALGLRRGVSDTGGAHRLLMPKMRVSLGYGMGNAGYIYGAQIQARIKTPITVNLTPPA